MSIVSALPDVIACARGEGEGKVLGKSMGFLDYFTKPEFQVGDFLLPWGMVVGVLGFLAAWLVVNVMERLTWTRHVWHLPLFFVALAIFFGCAIGLILAP